MKSFRARRLSVRTISSIKSPPGTDSLFAMKHLKSRRGPRSPALFSPTCTEIPRRIERCARALTCLRGASLKCYCPFLHLFYGYFATVAELRHGASGHDCGAFPSLLKSARDRSSVWEIRFDPAARKDRRARRTDRVPSWPLVGGTVASLSRPSPRILIEVFHIDGSARSYDPWMATPTYDRKNRATLKECDRNAND